MSDIIEPWHYFTSPVYKINKPEFLKIASKVCLEHLEQKKKTEKINEIYPLYNTDGLQNDERLLELIQYVVATSWNILDQQGYNMSLYEMQVYNFWAQEHHKHSGHERHIHNSVISGFYFIDTPHQSCHLVIHEPRDVKEFANLIEKDMALVSYGSNSIHFTPEPGMLVFTNSWLPHSFTKNESDKPFRMIHFNIGVLYKPPIQQEAIII
jgi:uncharacterized protein (TIGR02466 family)